MNAQTKPAPHEPPEFKGVLPLGSTPTQTGLWLAFNNDRTYVWQEGTWTEVALQTTETNT